MGYCRFLSLRRSAYMDDCWQLIIPESRVKWIIILKGRNEEFMAFGEMWALCKCTRRFITHLNHQLGLTQLDRNTYISVCITTSIQGYSPSYQQLLMDSTLSRNALFAHKWIMQRWVGSSNISSFAAIINSMCYDECGTNWQLRRLQRYY